MPSAAMQALKNRRKLQIDEKQAIQAADDNPTVESQPEHDVDTNQPEQNSQPETADNNQPDDKPTDDVKQGDEKPDDNHRQDDVYKRKFERVAGKVSGLEKAKHQAEEKAKAAEAELAEIRARLIAKEEAQSVYHQSQLDNSDEQDTETLDDGFDWWDEQDKSAPTKAKLQAEEKAKAQNKTPPVDIDARVNEILAEKDKVHRQQRFIKDMDKTLSAMGETSTFMELINEPTFDAFINDNRLRTAVFNDAAKHQDDESVEMLSTLIKDYLNIDSSPKKPSKKTPTVKKQSQKMPDNKPPQITKTQYIQAVKDKRHPSKRQAANKVIAAWHKQNE